MASVFQSLSKHGEGPRAKRHLILPMVRLLDNEALLPDNVSPLQLDSGLNPIDLEIHIPEAPEEPQIGFRWDSDASYQSEMRYGRRSKLELLWRLGAIPFNRNLHLKRLRWETTDRLFITPNTYGTLVRSTEKQHQTEYGISNGDFIRAGWVHRLFSGERTMEENTPAAQQLRKMNRMKGIVAYLEKLDEQLIRGQKGCEDAGICGYNKDKLWTWDSHQLIMLRKACLSEEAWAVSRVQNFEDRAIDLLNTVDRQLRWLSTEEWNEVDPQTVSGHAAQLALAGYVSSNSTFSAAAADLIRARFLIKSSSINKSSAAAAHINFSLLHGPKVPQVQQNQGSGYAFPLSSRSDTFLWRNGRLPDALNLRYDALTFDPTLLLDGLRLLSPPYQSKRLFENVLPPHHLRSLFSHQLHALLMSPEGEEISRQPSSLAVGAGFDMKIASLAAYLDDAKLLSRVVQRHQLRYIDPITGSKRTDLDYGDPDVKEALDLVEAMYSGIANVGFPLTDRNPKESINFLDTSFGL